MKDYHFNGTILKTVGISILVVGVVGAVNIFFSNQQELFSEVIACGCLLGSTFMCGVLWGIGLLLQSNYDVLKLSEAKLKETKKTPPD